MAEPVPPRRTVRPRTAWRHQRALTTTITAPETISSLRPAVAAIDPTQPFLVRFTPRATAAGAPRGTIHHAGPSVDVTTEINADSDPLDHLGPLDPLDRVDPGEPARARRVPAFDRPPLPDLVDTTSTIRPFQPSEPAPRTRPRDTPVTRTTSSSSSERSSERHGADAAPPMAPNHRRTHHADGPTRPGLGQPRLAHGDDPATGRGIDSPAVGSNRVAPPPDIRRSVADGLGVPLDDVVLERGPTARREAAALDATAFAADGNRIVLPDDLGPIDHPDVRGVIAHELSHIAQQRRLGAHLPDEASPGGRLLEAQARAAEQSARGDLGAPTIAAHLRAHDELSGAAARSDWIAGDLAGGPPVATFGHAGVQRLPTGSRTPDYGWQRQYVIEHGGDGIGDLRDMFRLEEGDPAAELESHHLDQLVRFRATKRADYVRTGGGHAEADARAAFRQLPTRPVEGSATPELSAEQVQAKAELDALRTRVAHDERQTQLQHEAVDQIDTHFPLRNFAADTGARYSAPSPQRDQWQQRIGEIESTHPTLVHRASPSRDSTPPTVTSAASASLATPPQLSAAPASSAPQSPSPSPPAATASASGAGTPVSTAPDISWQAGVFSPAAEGMSWDSLGSMFRLTEPTPEEREREARNQEAGHLPELIASRNQLLTSKVGDQVQLIRREIFRRVPRADSPGAQPDTPSDDELLSRITTAEWQAIINAVENERPLAFALDPRNAVLETADKKYKEAVIAAPAARRPDGEVDASAPAATGAPAAGTTGGPASPAVAAPAPTAAVEPALGPPSDPAASVGGGTGATPSAGATAAAAVTGTATLAGHRAGAADAEDIDAELLEFSPQVLNRLVNEIYPRLRSRLRTELLVDRERSGRLADTR